MHSIRYRLIGMVTGMVLIISLFLGLINIKNINKFETNEASMSMNEMCYKNGEKVNLLLIRAEDVVKYVASAMQNYITGPNDLDNFHFRKNLKKYLSQTFLNATSDIDGIDTFYLHFNVDKVPNDGFWYIKNVKSGRYDSVKIVDVSKYGESSEGRTNWYYKPVEVGEAVWLSPYLNENISVYMISYCMPVYFYGKLVGVVGVDINFDSIKDIVKDMTIYKSGYAYISSVEIGKVYYHPEIPSGISGAGGDIEFTSNQELLSESSSGDELISYTYEGKKKALAFETLRNGMMLVLTAPTQEIFSERQKSITEAIAVICIAYIIAFIVVVSSSEHIIKPLMKLTDAAKRIQEGDYDFTIEKSFDDEVGELADAMNASLIKINESVSTIKKMAYHDELTGVKNHTAYEEEVRMLEEAIKDGDAEFGIVMLDMNGLKAINDNYGHSKGDIAIRLMSSVICDTFEHSPVFRIGGDEFVAVLKGRDYNNKTELLEKLKPYQKAKDLNDSEPWLSVCVAVGYSEYDPKKDKEFLDVFKRADEAMYQNKKDLKAGR